MRYKRNGQADECPACTALIVLAAASATACAVIAIGLWQMEAGLRALAWVLNVLADTIDR